MAGGDRTKRGLLARLRRAKDAPSRSPAEETALWSAYEKAAQGVRDAQEASQHVASSLAKQRGAVDGAADRTRALTGRAQELGGALVKVAQVFDRLGLVALNAGLEGARIGDSAGRALTLVGDDVRDHATRGSELSRDLGAAVAELSTELGQLGQSVDRAREAA